ncbi:RING finger protein [Drechmeria coniospora]|uniref:RBR-type E3 ubiquitin transferase n=1 Tax=Drechmeria coniospora TaxID=98403 RepID=A0A151GNF7_DRECN|nr:RING finger protein [Drechmeria coniospora]KYK58645.1 RING finger protein [Drechmeria coniospora]ODA84010.1 hypothetical protein RJ55_02528 [Drechmeria coniospora]
MDATADDDDPRSTELESLEAIFPEIQHPPFDGHHAPSPFTFELELPVRPAEPVTVLFPAASSAVQDDQQSADGAVNGVASELVDSLLVSHLPPVSLRISLPDGYPSLCPPEVTISTAPQWLSPQTLAALEHDSLRLWEEAGRDLVAFTYIDHVQREAENVFGTIASDGTLEVHPDHKLAVLDYDIKAGKAAFEQGTFECGICLDPKKGSRCHRMLDCGHIFCFQCLQDFYNDAIKDGNLSTVRCVTPDCAKDRAAAATGGRKPKTFVSPSELLQIGLTEEMVKRYVTLKYKTELESDKNTIYCPRQWCNGAARSKRHKKPEGLEFADASDASDQDSDRGDDISHERRRDGKRKGKRKEAEKFDRADLLSVCEDCGFAFCNRCLQTWHGEFVRCAPKRNEGELTEEEKASIEYLKLHTSPCPTCNAPAQKTHGCNHMICSRCDTHFCYLCSSWLDPANPYRHYNEQAGGKLTSCYMRLWELEGGDGDDVGIGFVGGRGPPADLQQGLDAQAGDLIAVAAESDESDASDESDTETEDRVPEPRQDGQDRREQPVAVAREAPLVLRLMDNQPRGGARGGRDEPALPVVRGRGGGARGARVARGARRGRGRGGRGAAAAPLQQQQGVARADELDLDQEAWVRRFVQMALIDAEDEFDDGV